jgi:hypothetical protein
MTDRTFARLHALLAAAVVVAASGALTYLITGQPLMWWVVVFSGEVAYLLTNALPKANRTLEQLALEAAYDARAFGEDGPAGGGR